MSRVFIDTNVLLYYYTSSEVVKRERVVSLASENSIVVSTQVLSEMANVLSRKFANSWASIRDAVQEVSESFEVTTITESTVEQACSIAERHRMSYYDSLIVGAALEAGCSLLYSEDMHNGLVIESKVTILNPFAR
jgi:predicted nucleic acid-binding protein